LHIDVYHTGGPVLGIPDHLITALLHVNPKRIKEEGKNKKQNKVEETSGPPSPEKLTSKKGEEEKKKTRRAQAEGRNKRQDGQE
jgi:hypothetical protein